MDIQKIIKEAMEMKEEERIHWVSGRYYQNIEKRCGKFLLVWTSGKYVYIGEFDDILGVGRMGSKDYISRHIKFLHLVYHYENTGNAEWKDIVKGYAFSKEK